MSRAFLLFGKGKFDEVLEIISTLEYPNFLTKVRIKQLKVKCLYELNDYLRFDGEHKSIYHFLKNNKSLSLKIKSDTEFLFIKIKKMFRLKENFDLFEFEKLKKEISESSLNKTSWLSEKINEMK